MHTEKRSEFLHRAAKLLKELAKEQAAVERASEARRNLAPGSSRARVTTANARWSSAAEARDRTANELRNMGIEIKG